MEAYSVFYINKNTQITDACFLALVSHPSAFWYMGQA